jgi:S1-C subfamily serine protease
VTLADTREFTAEVSGTDPKTDLAVLKIEVDKLPSLALNQVALGQRLGFVKMMSLLS